MSDPIVMLSSQTADSLMRARDDVESGRWQTVQERHARYGDDVADWDWVRITSSTAVSGHYPGMLLSYDTATNTFSDLAEIWVFPAGSTPMTTIRYQARRGDYRTLSGSTRPVFTLYGSFISFNITTSTASVSTTGTVTFQIVTDVSTGLTWAETTEANGVAVGTLSCLAATLTQWGVVTTVTQEFNGDKYFDDNVYLSANISESPADVFPGTYGGSYGGAYVRGDLYVGQDTVGGGATPTIILRYGAAPYNHGLFGLTSSNVYFSYKPSAVTHGTLSLTTGGLNLTATGASYAYSIGVDSGIWATVGALSDITVKGGIVTGSSAYTLQVSDIPSLPASKITSGVLDAARIPNLEDLGGSLAFGDITGAITAGQLPATPVANGTYTVGARLTGGGTDGTITIQDGVITAVQQAT